MELFGAAGDEVHLVGRGGFIISNKARRPRLASLIFAPYQSFEPL
jgi:hypothetical protein